MDGGLRVGAVMRTINGEELCVSRCSRRERRFCRVVSGPATVLFSTLPRTGLVSFLLFYWIKSSKLCGEMYRYCLSRVGLVS